MKYIATYNPQLKGRLGMKLYERLVQNVRARCLMRCSANDVFFRQNESGLSLPVTPSSHGASTIRTISHGSTPKYLNTRGSTTFLPIFRVIQQRMSARIEPRSDGERWIQRTRISILALRRRCVEKRCPLKEASHATLHCI
jgi:hypothetical protein